MPLPTLASFEQQPGFRWTGSIAEHPNFHCFTTDAPVHLDADDYDPWSEEPDAALTLYGQAEK